MRRETKRQMDKLNISDWNYENDISSAFKWLGSSNVDVKTPGLSALSRTLNEEHALFEKEFDQEIIRHF